MRSRAIEELEAVSVRLQGGQSMIEYALIAALVAIVLIGALVALGGAIEAKFTQITTTLQGAGGG
jgi:pilus assembly protein Flp/PilA